MLALVSGFLSSIVDGPMFPLPVRRTKICLIGRSRLYWRCALIILGCALFSSPLFAQSKCQPPSPPANPANLFSEEQEMVLGDAVAEQIESSFSLIDDEQVVGYLRRIGERLIAQAPPTKLRFQFFVVDSYEVNAFTLPGGRIYVTRKLISF